jgi:multicomponent Na+:H+ antiporter subunit A
VLALLAVYGLVGVGLLPLGARLRRWTFLVGALPMLATIAWLAAQLAGIIDRHALSERVRWVAQLHLTLQFRVDAFSATMILVIAGIGVAVMAYAARYFGSSERDLGRIAGLLVLFAGAMVGLVEADNVFFFYVCWELTSITSYLLIGNAYENPRARGAALQALLITSAGGLAMLAGFVVLGSATGSYSFREITAAGGLPAGAAVTVAVVLVLLGAFTKSAQYPFHSWLPGAMTAATPISAYLHSATMVTAGVYLVARLAPAFSTLDVWRPLVLGVGTVTFLVGALRALRQHDLKLMLAFGTVSQLGLMVLLFGAGTSSAAIAGWALLVAHALYKCALFMIVGILEHHTGTRDLRELPPLGRQWTWVKVAAAVSAASMAGLPLVAGFVAKEAAFEAYIDATFAGHWLVLAAIVVGSAVTVAYAIRFYWGAFVVPGRDRRTAPPTASAPPSVPVWQFTAPALVLAAGTALLGLAPGITDSLAEAAARALGATRSIPHLALWHGVGGALLLTVLALAAGIVIAARDRVVQPVLSIGSRVPDGDRVFRQLLRGLVTTARRVTGVVQSGSLPVYAGVILATAAALPLVVLATSGTWPGLPELVGRVGDVPVVGMLVVAALGAATVRRRFSAALFLGAAGYAMAGLFVVYGAPDLALTQVAVETLSTVVFVLVLRWLPERFERQSTTRRRVLRLAIAGLVGAMVFVFAITAGSSRTERPISGEMVRRAVPDGHGRNVVNVILVDFRGFDTLGEITVLVAASIGAVALARVGLRAAAARRPQPDPETPDPAQRIVFVELSVQVIFSVVLMASLWLLFAGHNHPGGGFVAGLLAGSAITLRYIAGGIAEVRARSRFRPWTVLGSGLLIAVIVAGFPLVGGGSVLDVASGSVDVPVIGDVQLSSALVFDIGVYLTVIGMVLMAFEAFGDRPKVTR